MKLSLIILFVFSLVRSNFYSQNLVPNPSFENVDCSNLSTGLGKIIKVIPWKSTTSSVGGVCDYYNLCIPDTNFTTPSNTIGFQNPRTGNAYIGLSVFNSTIKDGNRFYAHIKMDTIFNPCKDYQIEFYVSLADRVTYAISTIGVYFSDTTITSNDYLFLPYKPQISNDPLKPMMDTSNWMSINGVYNAKGGERYLTIGNFSNDINTLLDSFPPSQYINRLSSYYYLDDVSVTELPTVRSANAGTTTNICQGTSVILGTAVDTTGIKINWQPALGLSDNTLPQPIATPLQTTTYTLTLTYNCGTTSTDTVTVFVHKPVVTITSTNTNLCPGETGTAMVTVNNGISPYTYSWSNGASTGSATVSGLAVGNYDVTVSDALGCTATSTVSFTAISGATAVITTATTTISEGEQIILNGSGGISYVWSPANTLSCTTCQSPTAAPSTTTTYTLSVTAANGCTDTSDVTIKVNPLCLDEKTIFIPNIFSPNNDGKNDVLAIEGSGLTNIYWGIYDRWGNLVFETYNQNQAWDGTKRGSVVETGVYVYYLRATCSKTNAVVSLKGSVSVVK